MSFSLQAINSSPKPIDLPGKVVLKLILLLSLLAKPFFFVIVPKEMIRNVHKKVNIPVLQLVAHSVALRIIRDLSSQKKVGSSCIRILSLQCS